MTVPNMATLLEQNQRRKPLVRLRNPGLPIRQSRNWEIAATRRPTLGRAIFLSLFDKSLDGVRRNQPSVTDANVLQPSRPTQFADCPCSRSEEHTSELQSRVDL